MIDLKEEFNTLNLLLKKKKLTYMEFNELIGNYFIVDHEELDDDCYLLKIITPGCEKSKSYYTDYINLID